MGLEEIALVLGMFGITAIAYTSRQKGVIALCLAIEGVLLLARALFVQITGVEGNILGASLIGGLLVVSSLVYYFRRDVIAAALLWGCPTIGLMVGVLMGLLLFYLSNPKDAVSTMFITIVYSAMVFTIVDAVHDMNLAESS